MEYDKIEKGGQPYHKRSYNFFTHEFLDYIAQISEKKKF